MQRKMSLSERFDSLLPPWMQEIRVEAYQKISESRFAGLCYVGNEEAMRLLIIGLWQFVDDFPHIVGRGKRCLTRLSHVEMHGMKEMISLLRKTKKILREIQTDEEDHRNLWLETGRALGLIYPENFKQEPLPEVKNWIKAVDEESDPLTMFLKFAAIEIIAESISKHLLPSSNFTAVLGKRGCEWFRLHTVHHPGVSHEELALRIGFAFCQGDPIKNLCNATIQNIVDHFVIAAEACLTLCP